MKNRIHLNNVTGMNTTFTQKALLNLVWPILMLGMSITPLMAQNVGINFNNSVPNASAALDIDVTALAGGKKGLLIPRVTQSERNAMEPLPVAARGLLVYQTDGEAGFYYNTSANVIPAWKQLLSPGSLRWDLLQSATSNLSLNNTDNPTNITFNGFTEGNAFSLSSNSLTKGNLLNLSGTFNNGAFGFTTAMVNIAHAGTNANSNHTSIGVSAIVSNTGVNSTNYAGYFKASGGSFNYAIFVPEGGGKVSIGSGLASPNALLTIKNGHFESQQTVAPSIATTLNAGGLSDGTVEVGSSDMAGTFSINTTNGSLAAGAQATITFNETFSGKPRVVVTAASATAASRSFYVTATSSGFTIYFTSAPLAGTSYTYNYMVIEN